jgi:predicted MPP superfamily phosphohydrolase
MGSWRPRLTRRRFLKWAGGSLALGLGLGAYAWRVEPHWLEFVHRDLPIPGLPAALHGRTLAQVSDLHVGPVVDSEYLIDSLQRLSALHPDLVVFTGDFMSCYRGEQIDEVARVLEHLAAPPLGCFGVSGNHDYGEHWSRAEVVDQLAVRLGGLGVQLLQNSARTVAGLQVAGLNDLWSPRFHPDDVLPTLSADTPAIVLCHNPDACDLPIWSGFQGWILSGHTHGGQCRPPFLPPPMLPVKNTRYTAGAFDLGDGRRLYINRGLGYLKRVRFGVRPEITLFRLTPG